MCGRLVVPGLPVCECVRLSFTFCLARSLLTGPVSHYNTQHSPPPQHIIISSSSLDLQDFTDTTFMSPNCTYSGYFALKINEKFINKNRHLAESFGSTKECRDRPDRPGLELGNSLPVSAVEFLLRTTQWSQLLQLLTP